MSLLLGGCSAARPPAEAGAPVARSPDAASPRTPAPTPPVDDVVAQVISIALDRDVPVYTRGEEIELTLSVSETRFVYCYYQDDEGQIFRIFPNRFREQAQIEPGVPVSVPGQGDRFAIEFGGGLREEFVLCFASARELRDDLPGLVGAPDLVPIAGESVDSVESRFRKAEPRGLAVELLELVGD